MTDVVYALIPSGNSSENGNSNIIDNGNITVTIKQCNLI